jgi:DNA-binding transcriptional LysR family regulator
MFSIGNNIDMLPRMQIFAEVVTQGGFSKAASSLGISKSKVSKQVAQLEASLGVRLLSRTTRVVQATEAGELYYERCLEMLRIAEDAQGILSSIQEEAIGRIRISVPVSFGKEFLQGALVNYLNTFPRVQALIHMSDQRVDVLREGFDLAIRIGAVHDPDLIVRRLTETRRIVVASPRYLAEHGTPKDLEDLGSHECLLYEYQSNPEEWVFQRQGKKVDVKVSGRVRINNGDLLAEAASAGLGLAWLPDFIVKPQLESGELVLLLDSQCKESSTVNAVLPARKYIPLKVRELLRVLEQGLTEAPV